MNGPRGAVHPGPRPGHRVRVARAACGHWAVAVVHRAVFRAPSGAVIERAAIEHIAHLPTHAEAVALAAWTAWWRDPEHGLAAVEWVADRLIARDTIERRRNR